MLIILILGCLRCIKWPESLLRTISCAESVFSESLKNMGSILVSMTASMLLIATYYLLILGTLASADTANLQPLSQKPLNPPETPHFRTRAGLFAAARRLSLHRAKPVQELGWIFDEDEETPFGEVSKRFDDYGHMRFGKRGAGEGDQFDDYGHMRFGRRKRGLQH